LEKLVGEADLGPVKSAFIHVGLGAGSNQLYISPWSVGRSSNQTDVFIEKDAGLFTDSIAAARALQFLKCGKERAATERF
jgi:hypothetical protein